MVSPPATPTAVLKVSIARLSKLNELLTDTVILDIY